MKQKILVALFTSLVLCLALSCATIPRLKCINTISVPITIIGLDSIARTVYIPFCDSLRQLPPKKVKP